jgi:NADPH:quinone reductase-like Zn-dependent oxidoreductase
MDSRTLERRVSVKAVLQETYGSPDVLELRDIDRPEVGDGDVLLRVHAAGVEPGVWHLMTGLPYLVRIMAVVHDFAQENTSSGRLRSPFSTG